MPYHAPAAFYSILAASEKQNRSLLLTDDQFRVKAAVSSMLAALSPAMKKVFVRIVNTHLDGLLAKIDVPTLLFWGKEDKDTPPYMAKRFHKGIKDSGLVMLNGAGHFAYAERGDVFNAAVRVFTAKTE